jgi:hypothetical protein
MLGGKGGCIGGGVDMLVGVEETSGVLSCGGGSDDIQKGVIKVQFRSVRISDGGQAMMMSDDVHKSRLISCPAQAQG